MLAFDSYASLKLKKRKLTFDQCAANGGSEPKLTGAAKCMDVRYRKRPRNLQQLCLKIMQRIFIIRDI